jgi:hypothetical protein
VPVALPDHLGVDALTKRHGGVREPQAVADAARVRLLGKRPANERSVTPRPSLSLADTPALISTLRKTLSVTPRYLLTL